MTLHLTESQPTVSAVPSRQLPIHALLVLYLQFLVDLLIFLPYREHSRHRGHAGQFRPIHAWTDLSGRCGVGGATLITEGLWVTGNSVAAFQKCYIKELTTAEVWCGLVVTDDEAARMFLLENKNQYDSFASSLLRGNLATFTSNSPSQHPSDVKISASFHHFPDQLWPILKNHPTTVKRFIQNLSRNNIWLKPTASRLTDWNIWATKKKPH